MTEKHFCKFFYDYKDVLARDYQDIKVLKGHFLDIELKNPGSTSYIRQYPLPKADVDEIERQTGELLQIGIIKENDDSTFNSPCFLVSKRSGEKRLIVDLRAVNSLIKIKKVKLKKNRRAAPRNDGVKGKYFYNRRFVPWVLAIKVS